jgi:O-antigen/teichoic acid export membrane protein
VPEQRGPTAPRAIARCFAPVKRLFPWLRSQRTSTRLGFILQIFCRAGFSLFSFVWTPLLLGSMGAGLTGLFLNFQKWASLGSLGDLGMGGMVNMRASRLLGQDKADELKNFLAAARGIFLVMAVMAAAVFWSVSPGLFRLLKFDGDPQTGALPVLALVGGAAIALVVLNSYIVNLNYGCGNVVWPVVPTFVILQLAVLGHWLLARQHAVLWAQYLPYVCAAGLVQAMGWLYVKKSHPALGTLRPVQFNRRQFFDLFGGSFWIYLGSIGSGIWVTTDLFLITARFGAQTVPAYLYNQKLCELAAFVATSAGIASTPKITQWLASPETAARLRGLQELTRLGKFQTFLGCCAALVYLSVNDWFMRIWLGNNFQVPLLWQSAFATSLAVIGTSYAATEMVPRCCDGGIRVAGITSLLSALLNLGLSLVAMELSPVVGMNNSIFGIALATVIAQSSLVLYLGRFTARQLKISWWQLHVKNWLLALGTVAFGIFVRVAVPPGGAMHVVLLVVIQLAAFLMIARVVGISLDDLRQEKEIFLTMLGGRKKTVT